MRITRSLHASIHVHGSLSLSPSGSLPFPAGFGEGAGSWSRRRAGSRNGTSAASVVLALSLFLAPSLAAAQTPSPSPSPAASPVLDAATQAKLAETKAEIEKVAQRIATATEKEAALLEALDETGHQIFDLEQDIAQLVAQAKIKRDEAETNRAAMETLRERIGKRKRWLAGRLRSLHIHGRPGYLRILFASESYGDLVRRTKYQSIIARHEARMVGGMKKDLAEVARHGADYEKDLALYESMESDARGHGEELKLEKQFRQSLLDEVKSERRNFEKMRGALESASDALSKQVGAFGRSVEPAAIGKKFETLKGRLLPPVSKMPVTLPYGPYKHPKLGLPMIHQGISYATPLGTEVKSVGDGKVEMARWFSSYGQVLIVDHGEGWRTLYAHNGKLLKQVGDAVREGEVVALSGDTGSLEGPELYFAIFREGKPIDPSEWLLK